MYTRVSPNVKYGLLVIVMYQWRFISYNRRTTLLGYVDNEKAMHV